MGVEWGSLEGLEEVGKTVVLIVENQLNCDF